MPRDKPQLSITLPRNFTFHYTEGEEPKTPEQEEAAPADVPSPPHAYRIKRRVRPSIQTSTQTQARLTQHLQDAPIPTIEAPAVFEPQPLRPSLQQSTTEPTEGFLAPSAIRPFMTQPRPRTPTMQRVQLSDFMRSTPPPRDLGDSIIRPLSRCSITSDSSDDSNGSLTSYPSLGGSCTSPESDAADPFVLPSIPKFKGLKPDFLAMTELSQDVPKPLLPKQPAIHWTSEMDKHLWSTYMQYVQDPTITPFKTLPGSAPPLGVCHRVARLARRTWRGAGQTLRSPLSNESTASLCSDSNTLTPVVPSTPTAAVWPKSSSSTRRRLRFLSKRKPTIAPHYQRLLRSPSPFSSSSQARSARASSPLCQEQIAFDTREIQFSLTTSTAATMQPNGPLAQLSRDSLPGAQQLPGHFSDPAVPWASPPAVPSSDPHYETLPHDLAGQPSYLGSPFSGSRTWGPSRTRQQTRPSTPRAQSTQQASTIGPMLKSPVRFNRNPYSSVNKRRAQHQLEDELSPGGSDKRNLIDELFGGHTEGSHRRVRSRGFSLGDISGNGHLEASFQGPNPEQQAPQLLSEPSETSTLQLPNSGQSIRRLGSPFSTSGGGSMPTRRPSRHLASASLSAFDPGNFASIDQRIRQTDLSEDFLKKLRE
ncbi:MAG: hypothetical protein Q9170_003001 [Blastenia crenularia]